MGGDWSVGKPSERLLRIELLLADGIMMPVAHLWMTTAGSGRPASLA